MAGTGDRHTHDPGPDAANYTHSHEGGNHPHAHPTYRSESAGDVLPPLTLTLEGWWMAAASGDLERLLPKVAEYTSADLEVMGAVMSEWGLAGPEGDGSVSPANTPGEGGMGATLAGGSTASGMEAACLWYILGKVARCVAAYKDGRLPSEDTLHDIVVYAMMARRIRETGQWP